MPPPPYVFLSISVINLGIRTVNETGIPYNFLHASLDIFGAIILILNCYTRIPIAKVLLLVVLEDLIIFRNGHKNMLLHATPSLSENYTVISCEFIMK